MDRLETLTSLITERIFFYLYSSMDRLETHPHLIMANPLSKFIFQYG